MVLPQDSGVETLTFLFTDIEGSTRLLQQLGDAYGAVLAAHHQLLRDALLRECGTEVRTEGDSFFVVFPSAVQACNAAIEAQRAIVAYPWPEGGQVRVRMGLHTGESTRTGGEYVGLDVHRAARIAAAANGGQVLISDSTRALVQHTLAPGVRLRDLGSHRLKDLPHPERLFQLEADGLPAAFPPLRSLDARHNNLPPQLTSFVGRERETAEARRQLGSARLLTLTGPGGTGKTRLSLQLAADLIEQFDDGVYFVPLAPLSNPDLVPMAVAQALGLQDTGSRPPAERVLEHLRDKHLLLVLDNFEHLLAGAPFVGELLRAGARLKVVVTSRSALHVYGEREFPVPPLQLPDPKALPRDLQALSQYEAVRLFIERAVAVKPDFAVTNENAPAVAGICARLDGLPLAIELAAARVKLLPPHAMLARLEHRLTVLAGGSRDLPERQQTLRGAIAWSYDLLDPPHRRLFARFAVFVGGGTLDTAETVCGPAEELGVDVFEGLAALVDHSLLRQDEQEEEPRFDMLETIREFALEQLRASGEDMEMQRRHAATFAALAEKAEPLLTGPKQKGWLDHLDREHDNVRAALMWCIDHDSAEVAMRLVAALWRFWHMRGHLHEARGWAEQVLRLPHSEVHPAARVRTLEAAGGLAYWQGDIAAMTGFYEDALTLSRELGDQKSIANALYNLSFRSVIDGSEVSRGMDLLEEALAIYRALGDRPGIAKTLWGLGTAKYFGHAHPAAKQVLSESLTLYRELNDRFGLAWTLHMLGLVAIKLGDLADARTMLGQSIRLFVEAGDVSGVVLALDDFAELAAASRELERAMRLAGAAAALTASSGVELATMVNQVMGRYQPGDQLDNETIARLWEEGRAMTLDQAVAYALSPASEVMATA